MTNFKSKEEVVTLMKAEVTNLVLDRTIPVNVKTFGELHAYVDANELGGLTTQDFATAWNWTDGMSQKTLDFINDCQDEVDLWIRDGDLQIRVEDESHESFTPWSYGELLTKYKALMQAVDTATCTPFAPSLMDRVAALRLVWINHRNT